MFLLTCFYNFALYSLICSSILHPDTQYMLPFMRVRYCFYVLFVTPKSSFVYLHVCISLTGHGQVGYNCSLQCQPCASPLTIPCLCPSLPHLVFPLLRTSAIVPHSHFSTLCHCFRIVKLWLHHRAIRKIQQIRLSHLIRRKIVVIGKPSQNKAAYRSRKLHTEQS